MMKLMPFAAVALTLLAGCMLGPDYQRPTLPLPAQHRDAEPPPLAVRPLSLADLQWFELFQDEGLQALIRTALQQNYDVRIAVGRILEAQAQLGISRSFLFPHSTVTAPSPESHLGGALSGRTLGPERR